MVDLSFICRRYSPVCTLVISRLQSRRNFCRLALLLDLISSFKNFLIRTMLRSLSSISHIFILLLLLATSPICCQKLIQFMQNLYDLLLPKYWKVSGEFHLEWEHILYRAYQIMFPHLLDRITKVLRRWLFSIIYEITYILQNEDFR